ncbi:MAG: protein TolR [Proteobacteria bacterium]|nr:MAG: protein TolR [Pseudomonadota bacterium]
MAGFGGGRRRSNHIGGDDQLGSGEVLSEINVTPMVDVMLVLLIIFMVSAPLMQQGVQVDLPKTKSPALAEQEKPVILVVTKGGNVQINGNVIPNSEISDKLKAIFEKREKKEIFIQADKSIPYGSVASVMAQAQAAGISRIGLVTDPSDKR